MNRTFIAAGSEWRYLDNGSNQGTKWRARLFDDSKWSTGPAQLGYGNNGEFVGLDVKAMRTQKKNVSCKHLSNSRTIFLKLVEVSRGLDKKKIAALRKERDYEELELYIMKCLMQGW